jgi:hypothetical protein
MAWKTWTAGDVLTAADINKQSPTLCTSSTRPTGGNLYEGVIITETDTERVLYYDGTNWVILAEPQQTWTPTWTNLTIGNATQTGRYKRSDGWCDISLTVTLGSTTTVGTDPQFTLPVATAGMPAGALSVAALDLSPIARYVGSHAAVGAAGTTVDLSILAASGSYAQFAAITASVPFTWATGDVIYVSGRFQMNTRYL